ncbi:hypothetical protein NVIE_024720 [Nitrososphaera viennensis EN76]|uniref:Uncharacterized protein n=1 Tax=Nitrososphaera viennensis EN76 TaxID=926571 RepID=A0A060HTE1_9ARCH|nr:hypothetical protein NVIE_024720 [Nitrososphaera viennensis EN76]
MQTCGKRRGTTGRYSDPVCVLANFSTHFLSSSFLSSVFTSFAACSAKVESIELGNNPAVSARLGRIETGANRCVILFDAAFSRSSSSRLRTSSKLSLLQLSDACSAISGKCFISSIIQGLNIPAAGTHVMIIGSYVLDQGHFDWAEIHPVTSITPTN